MDPKTACSAAAEESFRIADGCPPAPGDAAPRAVQNARMSFPACLDALEHKTGLAPRQLLELTKERGLDQPGVKAAAAILEWLRIDHGRGRRRGMALLQKGPQIGQKHGSAGSHRDESETLWLDGSASRPE